MTGHYGGTYKPVMEKPLNSKKDGSEPWEIEVRQCLPMEC